MTHISATSQITPEKNATNLRMLTLSEKLPTIFTYQPADAKQQQQFVLIREAALHLAQVILANTPGSADQTAAIRLLREAVMTANAAISLKGIV